MRQENGSKTSGGPASQKKRGVKQALVERPESERELQSRMRKRKENTSGQQSRHAVERRRKEQSVVAEEIDESHGRHEGGRQKRDHEKQAQRLAARRLRHRHGIGENAAQDCAQKRREAAHPKGVANGTKHRTRKKHAENVACRRRSGEGLSHQGSQGKQNPDGERNREEKKEAAHHHRHHLASGRRTTSSAPS